jgi:integrase
MMAIKKGRHGYAFFRGTYKGVPLWVGTGLPYDDDVSRRKLELKASVMSDEMKAGTFDYGKWFPHGPQLWRFHTAVAEPEPAIVVIPTLNVFYEGWIAKKIEPLVRTSLRKSYVQHYIAYIRPFMGDMPMDKVTVDTLEDFRSCLLGERKLSLKSAKNIISGTLSAMFRDSRLPVNVFNTIPNQWWPQVTTKLPPDPFSEDERDTIIEYFRTNRSFFEFAFIHFRFYTGVRPSEATALKWGSIDLRHSSAFIASSRTFQRDNACKTAASRRTIVLLSNVVEVLAQLRPLHVNESDYIFPNFCQNEFGRRFSDVLRVLNIRPRRSYNARHTYISVALTLGSNAKWVSEQVGTSLASIQNNYGRYIRGDGARLLEEYIQTVRRTSPAPTAKVVTPAA